MDDIKIVITDRDGVTKSTDNQYSDYSFVTDYNSMSSPFNLTLVNVDFEIITGDKVQFWLNDNLDYVGIIQRIQRSTSKGSDSVTLSGKDRSSILVENFCNNFRDYNNKSPIFIINDLVSQTDFYTKPKGSIQEVADSTGFSSSSDISDRNSAVLLDVNSSNTIPEQNHETTFDETFTALPVRATYKISVGDKVFDKVNDLVKSLGFEILYQNNGNLYIGDLNKKRFNDPIVYSTIYRSNGNGNNILSSDFTKDISGQFSSILVSSQVENQALDNPVNSFKIAKNSFVPQVKFMAMQVNDSIDSPRLLAIQEREDQRVAGFSLNYVVQGHTADNGEPWQINRYVDVDDDINRVAERLVLYSRTFSFSESSGTTTEISLSVEKNFTELEI